LIEENNSKEMIKIHETNVTIMVKDIDASIAFYQSIGLTLKQRWENHYAMMESTGLTIGLHPGNEDKITESKISIGFMIDAISEAKSLLDSNKIPYREDDGKSGIYLHFHDPDGVVLYFTQPKWKYDN
jgi:catechol 2,3-dioxygenase-like lactoylglutathione lyase family enzyme